MTRREFDALKQHLAGQTFHSLESDPILFGIERALFEKAKLNQLIAAAEAVGLKTTLLHAERLKRRLKIVDRSLSRFHEQQKCREHNINLL